MIREGKCQAVEPPALVFSGKMDADEAAGGEIWKSYMPKLGQPWWSGRSQRIYSR